MLVDHLRQGKAVDLGHVDIQEDHGDIGAEQVAVSGISLGLLAIVADTELLIELHEDWRDQPSGKKLVVGTLRLDRVGRPRGASSFFQKTVVLATQPYWLLIKATRGQAIWLL